MRVGWTECEWHRKSGHVVRGALGDVLGTGAGNRRRGPLLNMAESSKYVQV